MKSGLYCFVLGSIIGCQNLDLSRTEGGSVKVAEGPLRNANGLCLVPVAGKRAVQAIACSPNDSRQVWLYDESKNSLSNKLDPKFRTTMKSGRASFPMEPGLSLTGGQPNNALAVLLQLAKSVKAPERQPERRVKAGERFKVNHDEAVSIDFGSVLYSFRLAGIQDKRCPLSAFCFVERPAELHFVLKPLRINDSDYSSENLPQDSEVMMSYLNSAYKPMIGSLRPFKLEVYSLQPKGVDLEDEIAPTYELDLRLKPLVKIP